MLGFKPASDLAMSSPNNVPYKYEEAYFVSEIYSFMYFF